MEKQGRIEMSELKEFSMRNGNLANLIINIYHEMWNGKKITIKFEKDQQGITCGTVSWEIVKEE